jgi:threonine/homoserine/homoserine lactone efflux protein
MVIDVSLVTEVLVILTLAIVSPGPDFFMILRKSLIYGKRAGIFCALGIACGCIISFSLIAVGIDVLFKNSLIQSILSMACGTYLIYMGISSILHKSSNEKLNTYQQPPKKTISYFKNGLFTNVLNPKLYTFGTAVFIYMKTQQPNLATTAVIIIINALIAFMWFTTVSLLLSRPMIRQFYLKRERLMNWVLGLILIAIGGKIVFS